MNYGFKIIIGVNFSNNNWEDYQLKRKLMMIIMKCYLENG